MIKVGPAGGHGKTWDDEGRETIVHIFVLHGEQINSPIPICQRWKLGFVGDARW